MRRREDEPKPPTPRQALQNEAGLGDLELIDIYNNVNGTHMRRLNMDQLAEAATLAVDYFKDLGIKRRYL